MTAYFSYIGSMTGKTAQGRDFEWDNPPASNSASNLPPRLVPADKLYDIGVSTLWAMKQIEQGRYEGQQLDWGAWGLKMTGAELRALFGADNEYTVELAALQADESYILVAGELW